MVDFDRETVRPSATKKKQMLSSAMKRTSEWVFSQEIPSDIVVHVRGAAFSLHKFPLVSKCGLIKKLLSEAPDSKYSLIEIQDLPGGAEAFELIVKFCYGIDFEISTENLAMLRCASEYLSMTEDCSPGNLVSVTEAYLEEVALRSLSGAATVLHKSEGLLPLTEKLKLVSRCIDAIAYIACNDSQFSPRAVMNWCTEELTVLRIDTFRRVLTAMKARGFGQYALGPVIMLYAQKSLRGLDIFGRNRKQLDPKQEHEKRTVLETIVSLLPGEKNATSVSFLSMLLRAAVYLETTVACRHDLEKRMGSQLDQAVLDDLLIPSSSSDIGTAFDVDTVQSILKNYLDSEADGDVEHVGKLMESYLAEIASDENLTIERFVGIAELIPEEAKVTEDGMYRGIDIYLKAHPFLSDTERKNVCSLMNCQRLSREACAHAAKNDRLPAQTVVQVLYHEQQRIQNSTTTGSHKGGGSPAPSPKFGCRDEPGELSRLKRENDNLRLEVARLRMQLKETEKSSGNSTRAPSGKPPLPPKKASIINSVTKKIGGLYPFTGKAKTKQPKGRRHSVS